MFRIENHPGQLERAARYCAGRERLHHFGVLGLSPTATARDVAIAVSRFQAGAGLPMDGMPGPVTLRALFVADGCAPPPVVGFVLPRTLADLEFVCGHRVALREHPFNGARLQPGKELERHLAVFVFPVAGGTDRVTLHRAAGGAMLAAYGYAAGVSGHLARDVQGTVCRRKNWNPAAKPSTHAAGFAIDADPQSNGRRDQTPEIPARFFSAMRACGVICGRDFGQPEDPNATDPMHFQLVHDSAIDAVPILAA